MLETETMTTPTRTAALGLALSMLAAPAFAEGDVKAGKKVFNKCKACHVVDKEKNRVGPHLVGLYGRTAGTVEGFKYSDAMIEHGVEWNDETLAEYLAAPKKVVKGTKMAFAGLRKEKDIVNILAYLKEETAKE